MITDARPVLAGNVKFFHFFTTKGFQNSEKSSFNLDVNSRRAPLVVRDHREAKCEVVVFCLGGANLCQSNGAQIVATCLQFSLSSKSSARDSWRGPNCVAFNREMTCFYIALHSFVSG